MLGYTGTFKRIIEYFDVPVVPEEKSLGFIVWGPHMLIQNFRAFHAIVVFQFKTRVIDQLSSITIPRAMLLA